MSHAKMVAARKVRRANKRIRLGIDKVITGLVNNAAFMQAFALQLVPMCRSLVEAAHRRERERIVFERCGPPAPVPAEVKTFTAADITHSIGWEVIAGEDLDNRNISG